MQTIDDYLQGKDWVFNPQFSTGQTGKFYWVYHDGSLSDRFIIWPNKPLATVLLSFDSGETGCSFGSQKNWKVMCGVAVSDLLTEPPALSYQAEFELLIFDREISEQELKSALAIRPNDIQIADEALWKFLENLDPFCFVANLDGMYFIAKDKNLTEALYSNQAVAEAVKYRKEMLMKSRAESWKMLGPECGPEECSVEGCQRLRIKLAMRCFIHQISQ